MLYHVYAFERYNPDAAGLRGQQGESFVFTNMSEDDLRNRVIAAWDEGLPFTYDGLTVDTAKSLIRIYESELSIPAKTAQALENLGTEVTNTFITAPAGHRARARERESAVIATPSESVLRDHRRVMVVHGRNTRARDAMFTFLRALGLNPIEWDDAVRETGSGSPHNFDAVRAAMEIGQAVVVLLTAEDRAGLIQELAGPADAEDVELHGQPRQNVILEAGLAMGIDRDRVILVELGPIRRASDFDGLNAVRLTNSAASRQSLRTRLQTAGCAVAEVGTDWTRPEAGGDFDAAVVHAQ